MEETERVCQDPYIYFGDKKSEIMGETCQGVASGRRESTAQGFFSDLLYAKNQTMTLIPMSKNKYTEAK